MFVAVKRRCPRAYNWSSIQQRFLCHHHHHDSRLRPRPQLLSQKLSAIPCVDAIRKKRTPQQHQQYQYQPVVQGFGYSHQRRFSSSSSSISSVRDIQQYVGELNHKVSNLVPLSPFMDNVELSSDDIQTRQMVFQETTQLMQQLTHAVQKGLINPSGKHGRELSALLVHILRLYSVSIPPQPPQDDKEKINHLSAYQQCVKILKLMNTWNLNCHSQHTHYVIMAAVHENLWSDASDLFLQQIDPDIAGYTPIQISISSPVGLYAIAKHAQEGQENGTVVVEPVFEAVLNMSLVNPQDQDKCKTYICLFLGNIICGSFKKKYIMLEVSNKKKLFV